MKAYTLTIAALVLVAIALAVPTTAQTPTRPPGTRARPTGAQSTRPHSSRTRPTGQPTFSTHGTRPTIHPTRIPNNGSRPCGAWNVTDADSCTAFCSKHPHLMHPYATQLPFHSGATGSFNATGCCCTYGDAPTNLPASTRRPYPADESICCAINGGGDDPHNPASCSNYDWVGCASDISAAYSECKSCITPNDDDPADGNQCYDCFAKVFDAAGASLAQCCPCIWRLAQQLDQPDLEIDC